MSLIVSSIEFLVSSFSDRWLIAADLKATFQLQILGVKKNPQSPMYTQLGVMTKGTVIEVNVSELGMVTTGGKVVFGKYAQITNNPENDGCINAVLREFQFRLTFHITTFSDVSPLQLYDVALPYTTCISRSILYFCDFAAAHNFTYNVISGIDEYSHCSDFPRISEVEGGMVYLS